MWSSSVVDIKCSHHLVWSSIVWIYNFYPILLDKALKDTPKLTLTRLLKSSQQYTSSHAPATISIVSLGCAASDADIDNVLNFKSRNFSSPITYTSEDDVKFYVRNMLADVIRALGEEQRISISNELTVSELRPDLWLLMLEKDYHKTPIGFVEVKKPSLKSSRLMNPEILGQMFDYLNMLKSFFRLNFVLGLLTTFNEWRACWLPIHSTTVATLVKKDFNCEDLSIPDISDMGNETEDDIDGILPVSTSERKVLGTEIYQLDGSGDNLKMVTHAIRTMCQSKPIPSHLIAAEQEYVVYGKDDWYWSPSPWKNSDCLMFGRMPTSRCGNFYILKPLGAGEHGRVWLACSKSRLVCALKFSKKNDLCGAVRESEIWQKIGFKKSYVVTLMKNKYAIVMPYLLTCNRLKIQHNLTNLVRKAIEEFSLLGLCHDDISLANIGYYRQGKIIKVSFLDFSAVSEKDSPTAQKDMLDQLQNLASEIAQISIVEENVFLSAFNALSLT